MFSVSRVLYNNLMKASQDASKWRFINMGTRSQTQLKGDEITEDLSVCNSSGPRMFVVKDMQQMHGRRMPRKTVPRQRN